ncbi:NAD(P)-dependent alcohol dehydrogenase [Aquipuribacter nitratireducens]|uniref:NAD(P)-dependent alcohol dehydrogenase n=1 Tax=Aquipuribacter nitratireducens TaxID=650104 RepID=A0ABW0GM69_9MICO
MTTQQSQRPTRAPRTTAVPTRMRAAVRERYGPPATITSQARPVPSPGAGQVLVEVHAAGVDRGVWHLATGLPYVMRLGTGLRRPRQAVLGLDVAGVVVGVGEGVTRLAVGDRVFGIGTGTWAEYALAREDKLSLVPDGVDLVDAAAVPVSGATALQAVHDVARVQPGQRVLVLGASGGVGSYLVQVARAAGAHVTGVASASKLDLVRDLGAEEALDHRRHDPLDGSRCFDVVLDVGGRRPLRHLRRALTPDGTLVIVGGEGGDRVLGGTDRQLRALVLSLLVKQRLTTFVAGEGRASTDRLAVMLRDGTVRPAVGSRYPLERAADALTDLVEGRIRGKAVVVVRGEER